MDEITRELLTLLDRIEIESTEDGIQDIAKQRFDIAQKYGYSITYGVRVSGEIQ